MKLNKENVFLADVVNYSLKGLLCALGKGAGFSKSAQPIFYHVDYATTVEIFSDTLVKSGLLGAADILIIPSKIVALLERRYVYGLTVENYSQCIRDLDFSRKHLKVKDNDLLTKKDIIGLDKFDPGKKIGLRYPKDPNYSAYKIAQHIKKKSGLLVDVVISDSDSGGKKGLALINCPTIIATPIGATKGIRLFYCMRASAAAEATRNNIQNMAGVLIKPGDDQFMHARDHVGELRYRGFLNGNNEDDCKALH